MAFDLGLLKKHPYATGGIVIVGGIFVFYLLSSRGSSGGVSTSGSTDVLSADTALGQAQAAAAIQTNAQNAAIQTASINASVANNQTAASVTNTTNQTFAELIAALSGNKTSLEVTQSNNDAATLQAANTLQSQQNIYSIQEQALVHQYDVAAEENANNNATSLSGLVDQLNYAGQIQSQALGEATDLATQQNSLDQSVFNYVSSTGLANTPNKDNLDSTTALLQQILAGGNPSVAVANQQGTAASAVANAASGASIAASISKGASSVLTGLFG